MASRAAIAARASSRAFARNASSSAFASASAFASSAARTFAAAAASAFAAFAASTALASAASASGSAALWLSPPLACPSKAASNSDSTRSEYDERAPPCAELSSARSIRSVFSSESDAIAGTVPRRGFSDGGGSGVAAAILAAALARRMLDGVPRAPGVGFDGVQPIRRVVGRHLHRVLVPSTSTTSAPTPVSVTVNTLPFRTRAFFAKSSSTTPVRLSHRCSGSFDISGRAASGDGVTGLLRLSLCETRRERWRSRIPAPPSAPLEGVRGGLGVLPCGGAGCV